MGLLFFLFFLGDEFFEFGPVFLGRNITHAVFGATVAFVFFVTLEVESVVITQFFAFSDLTRGDQPDSIFDDVWFTIRFTRMINEACGVLLDVAIYVEAFVEFKNIHCTIGKATLVSFD